MKEKTKQRWQRIAVWAIIVLFVIGSIAVYLIGIVVPPNDVSNPEYSPPALQTLPEAQQNQAPASAAPAS